MKYRGAVPFPFDSTASRFWRNRRQIVSSISIAIPRETIPTLDGVARAAPPRRPIPAKYSRLVRQLDDFITPRRANIVGGPCLREDWFDPPLTLLFHVFSRGRFPSRSFLRHLYLVSFLFARALHAMITNERRNPAGISVQDKRILPANEQASALMAPTLLASAPVLVLS